MSLLFGCDFSSAPSARKPIVVAVGAARGARVTLSEVLRFRTLDAWGEWLCSNPAWLGGFDFPFGLPRELVVELGWPTEWLALITHYTGLSRAEIRTTFAAFCARRPVGGKFAHRACDGPAGSSPSMKWVNPPVAFMLHAGVPRLLAAGAVLPGLHVPTAPAPAPDLPHDPQRPLPQSRVALEAYPGLLARELIGRRSYKSDETAKQNQERWVARADLLGALERGATRLGLRLSLTHAQRDHLLADAQGDHLDAVLCLMQAAWCAERPASTVAGSTGYGLPATIDPIEGWIATA